MQIFGETPYDGVVSLPRYAQIIGYSERAFFGIAHPDNDRFECRALWTQQQREDIAAYLLEAQQDLEQIVHFFLKARWVVREDHVLRSPFLTDYGKVIAFGVVKSSELSLGVTVDLSTDPCTIDIPIVGVIPDFSTIKIFHPGTSEEIIPSSIVLASSISGITIFIPKCRLVMIAYQDNPPEGWVYSDDSHFDQTVDVKVVENDPLTPGFFIQQGMGCSFSYSAEISAPFRLVDPLIGKVEVGNPVTGCGFELSKIQLSYYSGMVGVERTVENIVVRLAHSKMATEPCGCDITQRLWKRDRNIPQILTKERINCPFGMSDGAWNAWKWACNNELVRATPLLGHMYGRKTLWRH